MNILKPKENIRKEKNLKKIALFKKVSGFKNQEESQPKKENHQISPP